MDKYECPICDNTFDDAIHRPRALPCGHGFCTLCIETCICRGNKACPLCRKEHGANSSFDLPVNFLLEELLHKSAISASQKYESNSDHEDDSVEMCPKHKGIPLYFHCKSHNVEVCHSCAVIDHHPTSCNLISLDDQIQENKQSQIVTIQTQKYVFMDTEKDLKMLLRKNIDFLNKQNNKKQELEKEVECLQNKIEQINQEMVNNGESQEQILDALLDCQKKQESFEIMENKLRAASCNQDIAKQCQIAKIKILQSQIWEETLRKELNMAKVFIPDKYAQVERTGIHRSSKIVKLNRETIIPSLSTEIIPPTSASLITEYEMDLTSGCTIVFMDFSARGHILGSVRIRVFSNMPHGQQFVMLALGTDGPTLKGATFSGRNLNGNGITLRNYVTETGSQSHKPLLSTLKQEQYATAKKGRLFPWWGQGAAFVIMTKDSSSTYYGHFGDIFMGEEVLDKIESGEYDITEIIISNCGIVFFDRTTKIKAAPRRIKAGTRRIKVGPRR